MSAVFLDGIDDNLVFVHGSCMATKTITLELDAYEKLRLAKRPGESFTEVVRRSRFEEVSATGTGLRKYLRGGGAGVSETYLNAIEAADKNDRPPDDPWA
jgi:hypothetical protein